MAYENCDFAGWVTKNNLKCSDGRTILRDAFADNDGKKVPLVWNHRHDGPENVLGHAILENREDGVYGYCFFNDADQGKLAKLLVQHGDVEALSIYANNLKQDQKKNVKHGVIREVSLVLAGANPGALIQTVMSHSADGDEFGEDEAIISLSAEGFCASLEHSDKNEKDEKDEEEAETESKEEKKDNAAEKSEEDSDKKKEEKTSESESEDEVKHATTDEGKEESKMADKEKTVKDVFDEMSDEQKNVVYFMIGQALEQEGKNKNDEEGDNDMKQNAFENEREDTVITHADFTEILAGAKRCGSFKEAFKDYYGDDALMHSIDTTGMETSTGTQTYGFNDASMLYPDYKALSNTPEWIKRNTEWVEDVLTSVHKSPFSRIKSVFANITEDEARAKGYIKGRQKKDEVFTLLKRTTSPQTIYKKQKLDRDDILDIVDIDVVVWIRAEMRLMLNEEKARAILIGDGRNPASDDKISETNIRPIATDVPLFNIQTAINAGANDTPAVIAKAIIDGAIRARKNYKGSGNPTFYTSEDWLTEMLLLEDGIGHKLYRTEQELATALRVKKIVTVEPMEGHNIEINSKEYPLIGIIANLIDYNVGSDKNGNQNFFEDFDIDFNQQKYLLEERFSGALIKPFSAITLYLNQAQASGGNP